MERNDVDVRLLDYWLTTYEKSEEMGIKIGDVAASVGKGLLAGLIGTAAITLSAMIEMRLRKREAGTTPADAAGKVLGVEPTGEEEKARFSNLVHWGYGTVWGAARGLMGAAGVRGPAATAAHFGAVWGTALIMLPSLKVAPPPAEWGAKEIAVSALHHCVYAAVTGLAYEFLDPENMGRGD
ncbi:MAG TPA: hypothetical protein VLB01_00950 [Thermodesulfobacteriota bacterium]|nr:hypothetical protein [Thermodesulfobacteriota bacterium]